ncbi:MAG TPA: LOG family protein [Ignavibacteriaceae bacterium]|nr:LOG family protein [Ignavibacteriaceae bacterium]
MSKVITIFGSSFPKEGNEQYTFAYNLGAALAEKGFEVCSGGFYGVMEAASKGALENGSEVYGVTVDIWGPRPNRYITKEIRCKNIFERIEKLMQLGDAFVILQGGTGTLLELAAVWEYLNKELSEGKPVICHSQMWKEIVAVMDKQMVYENRQPGLIKCLDSIDEIVEYLTKTL